MFLDSRYRALAAGDLVSTMSTIVIDPPEGHLATYLASLGRIAALEPRALYPAHGPSHRDAAAVIRHAIEHRAVRERRVLDALSAEPAPVSALLPTVYADVDRALWPLAERSLLAGLQKLVDEGRAREQAAGFAARG